VHYDPPGESSTYLHRSGRTARAGARGTVLSLLEGNQQKDARKMQKAIGISEPFTAPALDDLEITPVSMRRTAPHDQVDAEPRAKRNDRNGKKAKNKRDDRWETERPEKSAQAAATKAAKPDMTKGDGTVKFFNSGRGYGFIVPDSGDKDLFVHFSNIVTEGFKTLDNNQRVAFDVRDGRNGAEAFDVRIA
jgi:CspA family cold shock protein